MKGGTTGRKLPPENAAISQIRSTWVIGNDALHILHGASIVAPDDAARRIRTAIPGLLASRSPGLNRARPRPLEFRASTGVNLTPF